MKKWPLKWKLFTYLLGFSALLLAILWTFQTLFLDATHRFVREREMNSVIRTVEAEIDNPNLVELIHVLSVEHNMIISPTLYFEPFFRADRFLGSWDDLEIELFDDNQNFVLFRRGITTRAMDNILTVEETFTRADGTEISLTFSAILTPLTGTLGAIELQLVIISFILLISSTLLAFIVAGHISSPIKDLTKKAKKLATGNYDIDFQGSGFAEIESLSDTLNTATGELSEIENVRKELIANVSHDLRTPLTLILGYAEMIHDFPEENNPEVTGAIIKETKRLTSLVNDLLTLDSIEKNSTLVSSEFNLTRALSELIGSQQKLLKKEGFEISFSPDEDVHVTGDATKILQAFYNLLINAVNYSGEDKKIEIQQIVDGRSVRLAVIDFGMGVADEDLPFIWDRYYKSSGTHKRGVIGSGLGLSIVRKIIEAHGGEYGVESVVGEGSTFWFEIEIVKQV